MGGLSASPTKHTGSREYPPMKHPGNHFPPRSCRGSLAGPARQEAPGSMKRVGALSASPTKRTGSREYPPVNHPGNHSGSTCHSAIGALSQCPACQDKTWMPVPLSTQQPLHRREWARRALRAALKQKPSEQTEETPKRQTQTSCHGNSKRCIQDMCHGLSSYTLTLSLVLSFSIPLLWNLNSTSPPAAIMLQTLPLEALHASDASAMEASSVSHVSHWLRCPGDETSQTLWMEVSREWAKATTRCTGSTSREVHPGGEWAWLGAAWQR